MKRMVCIMFNIVSYDEFVRANRLPKNDAAHAAYSAYRDAAITLPESINDYDDALDRAFYHVISADNESTSYIKFCKNLYNLMSNTIDELGSTKQVDDIITASKDFCGYLEKYAKEIHNSDDGDDEHIVYI